VSVPKTQKPSTTPKPDKLHTTDSNTDSNTDKLVNSRMQCQALNPLNVFFLLCWEEISLLKRFSMMKNEDDEE